MSPGRKHSKEQISLDAKGACNMYSNLVMRTGACPVNRILLGYTHCSLVGNVNRELWVRRAFKAIKAPWRMQRVTVDDKLVVHCVSKWPVGTFQVEVTKPEIACAMSVLKHREERKGVLLV